jgi:hypothetical protein
MLQTPGVNLANMTNMTNIPNLSNVPTLPLVPQIMGPMMGCGYNDDDDYFNCCSTNDDDDFNDNYIVEEDEPDYLDMLWGEEEEGYGYEEEEGFCCGEETECYEDVDLSCGPCTPTFDDCEPCKPCKKCKPCKPCKKHCDSSETCESFDPCGTKKCKPKKCKPARRCKSPESFEPCGSRKGSNKVANAMQDIPSLSLLSERTEDYHILSEMKVGKSTTVADSSDYQSSTITLIKGVAQLRDNELIQLPIFKNIPENIEDICSFNNNIFVTCGSENIYRFVNLTSSPVIKTVNNVPLTKIVNFCGYLYGLSWGKLHILDSRTYSKTEWKWSPVTWTPTEISDIAGTLLGTHIYLTTPGVGYLYTLKNSSHTDPILVKKESIGNIKRVYGANIDEYLDIYKLDNMAILYPSKDRLEDIYGAVLTHDGEVIRIPSSLKDTIVDIKIVNWEPLYITV